LFEHDLFRKPVSTFRDHALISHCEEFGAAGAAGAAAGDTLGDVADVGGAAINWSMTERTASPAL
jgi:hypothetical protein